MLSQLSYAPICLSLSVCSLDDDSKYITTLFICQYLFESFFENFEIFFSRVKNTFFIPFFTPKSPFATTGCGSSSRKCLCLRAFYDKIELQKTKLRAVILSEADQDSAYGDFADAKFRLRAYALRSE